MEVLKGTGDCLKVNVIAHSKGASCIPVTQSAGWVCHSMWRHLRRLTLHTEDANLQIIYWVRFRKLRNKKSQTDIMERLKKLGDLKPDFLAGCRRFDRICLPKLE